MTASLLTEAVAPAHAPAAPAPAATEAPATVPPAVPPAAGEAKPAAAGGDAPAPTEKPATAEAAKPADAPVALKLALPEKGILDADDLAAVTKFASDHKLSQEQAQALVERDNALMTEVVADLQAGAKAQRDAWKAEFLADKEFGGAKAKESAELAARVLREYAGADLPLVTKLLDESGVGDHPALLRTLARVGRMMAEDRPAGGDGKGPATQVDLATALYGKA